MVKRTNIFSKLCKASKLLDVKKEQDTKYRMEVLEELKDFVYSGIYTKYRNKRILLDHEMIGSSSKVIAKRMEVTKDAVRLARKRVSDDLYAVLGEDVVERITLGDLDECKTVHDDIQAIKYMYHINDFLLDSVMDCLDNAYIGDGKDKFDLRECKDEIIFLSMFTLMRFELLVETLDSDKLNYVIRLIKGEGTYAEGDRLKVLKYITSPANVKDSDTLLRKFIDSMKAEDNN